MTADDPRPPDGTTPEMSDRVRALLARAAEEQLSEQQQVSGALRDLRARLDEVGERAAGSASVAHVERLSAAVAELHASVQELSARLEDRCSVLEAQAAALGERLVETEDRLSAHVDDAVFALAEVLLRRRPPATGPLRPPPPTEPEA